MSSGLKEALAIPHTWAGNSGRKETLSVMELLKGQESSKYCFSLFENIGEEGKGDRVACASPCEAAWCCQSLGLYVPTSMGTPRPQGPGSALVLLTHLYKGDAGVWQGKQGKVNL